MSRDLYVSRGLYVTHHKMQVIRNREVQNSYKSPRIHFKANSVAIIKIHAVLSRLSAFFSKNIFSFFTKILTTACPIIRPLGLWPGINPGRGLVSDHCPWAYTRLLPQGSYNRKSSCKKFSKK